MPFNERDSATGLMFMADNLEEPRKKSGLLPIIVPKQGLLLHKSFEISTQQ